LWIFSIFQILLYSPYFLAFHLRLLHLFFSFHILFCFRLSFFFHLGFLLLCLFLYLRIHLPWLACMQGLHFLGLMQFSWHKMTWLRRILFLNLQQGHL